MSAAKFVSFMRDIDRRVIYLVMLLSVILPLVLKLRLPTTVTPEVRGIYDKIESLVGTGKAVLVSFDYDPSTQPELQPMAKAVVRHCILRKVPIIGITNFITGSGLGSNAMNEVALEYQAENRKDWVFLGFQTPVVVVILGIGENIKEVFPTDYDGIRSTDIEVLKNITNYNEIGLVVSFAGNTLPLSWVTYAGTRYNVPIATGVTAVSASDFYPYLQTKQFIGMMGGIKGAAEYEELVDELDTRLGTLDQRMAAMTDADRAHWENDRFTARRAMNPQSVAHLVIIMFIILGNITYFLFERKSARI